MTATVNAYPRKQFFIEMFTRDIALEDCVLDLIDNSMDALLRVRHIDVEDEVLAVGTGRRASRRAAAQIRVEYSDKRVRVIDDCGGIKYDDAAKEVFCFGHSPGAAKGRLGVYGIGLKRAIFKIGNKVQIESHTPEDAFRVDIDVKEWAARDQDLRDWTFPRDEAEWRSYEEAAGDHDNGD